MGNFYWEKNWSTILEEQERLLRYPAFSDRKSVV